MHKERKRAIVRAIKQSRQNKQLSQNAWAKQHNITPSTMSNIMNEHNWDKVGDEMWQRAFLAVQHLMRGDQYNTHNLRQIKQACQDAQRHHRTVAVVGYTGGGKTTALKEYTAQTSDTYYVVCRSSFGVKDLVSKIAATMGVQAKGGRTIDLEEAVIERLSNNPQSLLILDSVSKLRKEATLQFIGDLAEAIEHRAGLLLAGVEFFKDHMDKMVVRNKRGFREFNRRIYTWTFLRPFKSDECQADATQMCYNNGIIDPKKIAAILQSASCFGTLDSGIKRMIKAKQN